MKSYRIQLVCPHMDHASWLVLEDIALSVTGVFNVLWDFDCPVHGQQAEKPLQVEETRDRRLDTARCSARGCINSGIEILGDRIFCRLIS